MGDDLANTLRTEIEHRFADTEVEFRSGDWAEGLVWVARISSPPGSVGEVDVTIHQGEIIVFLGDSTHVHFADEDSTQMVDDFCGFLDELRRGNVVTNGKGGWSHSFAEGRVWVTGGNPPDEPAPV